MVQTGKTSSAFQNRSTIKANRANEKVEKSKKKQQRKRNDRIRAAAKWEGKANRAEEKADKAQEKFQEKLQKRRYYRIHAQASPSGKLPQHRVADGVNRSVHKELAQEEEDNLGVQSAHWAEQTVEQGVKGVHRRQRRIYQKARHKVEKAEKKLDRTNVKALQKKAAAQDSYSSNPLSKWQQKRRIRKDYYAAKKAAGRRALSTIRPTTEQKLRQWVISHVNAKAVVLLLAGAYAVGMVVTMFSSCSLLFQGSAAAGAAMGTYPAADEEMLAAEAEYVAMEDQLRVSMESYESTHDYDEYHIEMDDTGHDPYVLISLITACHQDAWTLDEVKDTMERIFSRQYTVTEDVKVERRFRDEEVTWVDDDGESHTESQRVYYDYRICSVTMKNNDLSMQAMYILDENQLKSYSIYMAGLGNRPDLFPTSEYINKYINNPPEKYDIPQEYLDQDETFAAMMKEAEKYLGFPYVWGGTSPSTSFDCSGFVSWVINHSGWDVGRLGVLGLEDLCTPVSAAQAKPGDLVFFIGTYDAPLPGPTHVGIYVGDNMFIHCGDPISYASLGESYWQSHFYSFGRLYD